MADVQHILPAVIQRDPPVRRNGRCVVCGGERSQIAITNRDPFCKTECCKEWHSKRKKAVASGH